MKFNHKKFHTIHLWVDFSIGVMALIGLVIRDVLEAWYALDLTFHVVIFALALGVILVERLLHGGRHKSEALGKGLHRAHLVADLSISTMAVVGLLFEDVLSLFFEVDIVFHVLIIALATGGIVAEKVFHRHSGIIGS
jgi:hypothetical protein